MTNMCYHPWVGLDITPQKEFKPCCKYDQHLAITTDLKSYRESEELELLKQQFLAGERPAGCARCWKDEDANIPSKRQLDWDLVFNKEVPNLDNISVLSLTMGNTCNLSCRTCYSGASSKWMADDIKLKKHFPIIDVFTHQKFYKESEFVESMDRLAPNLIRVDFHGGEPLLSGLDQHLQFLDLVPHTASLHYITNGTIFPSADFLDRWKQYEHVDIQLSIDGIGNQFEYLRNGAVWDECLSNYGKYKELQRENPNIQISISHVVSIFTVMYLPELYMWCLRNKMPLPYLGILTNPSHFSITVFPKEIKDVIAAKLSNPKFAGVVAHMMSADNSKEFETAMKYVTLVDELRNQNFAATFPELYQLIKGYTC